MHVQKLRKFFKNCFLMRHEYTVIRLLSGAPCLLFRRIIISAQQTAQPAKYRQFEGGKIFSTRSLIYLRNNILVYSHVFVILFHSKSSLPLLIHLYERNSATLVINWTIVSFRPSSFLIDLQNVSR